MSKVTVDYWEDPEQERRYDCHLAIFPDDSSPIRLYKWEGSDLLDLHFCGTLNHLIELIKQLPKGQRGVL